MGIRKTVAVSVAAVAVGASVAGCGSDSTAGHAAPQASAGSGGEGGFDLCSTLSLTDVEPYIRTDLPLTARKRLTQGYGMKGATAVCEYGTWAEDGVTLSMPLSPTPPDAAVLKSLAYSAYNTSEDPVETTIGADRAITVQGDREVIVAVVHDALTIVVKWQRVGILDGQTMSVEKLTTLAETVIAKLPESLADVITVDLPTECDGIDAAPIVGKVDYARGSADTDNLLCDFYGEKGVLTMDSQAREPRLVKEDIGLARSRDPQLEVTPPTAPDVVLFEGLGNDRTGFSFDGKIDKGAEFEVEFEEVVQAGRYDPTRSLELDPQERTVLTAYSAAVTAWLN